MVLCSEPVIGGSYFSVAMGRDMTLKSGQHLQLAEFAGFGVRDDMVVTETFEVKVFSAETLYSANRF